MSVLELPSGATVGALPDIDPKEINEPGKALPKLQEIFQKYFGGATIDEELGKTFESGVQYIEPIFTCNKDVFHGPPGAPIEKDGNYKTTNWCGSVYVITPNKGEFEFRKIFGQWAVPSVAMPVQNIDQHMAIWIGIDGMGSSDVFQCGTAATTINRRTEYFCWTEWFPDPEVRNNFPAWPGDIIHCAAATYNESTGVILMTNHSRRVSTSFKLTAPAGISSIGSSAEWIVERPTVNGAKASLPNYGRCVFTRGTAPMNSQLFKAGRGTAVYMTDDSGKIISTAFPEVGTENCQCYYVGAVS